ncbi:uncharacterized protein BDZ99DRAFT_501503 [Mytilinidion resinicola]|uniref:Uncharacterized protein n=1 Tax=Mytilinidion resinicola TaxID=574789 RepID=A0A6A6YBG2_9PEZI|nr:uncharacterized protein BDZ99DRAFT_501503 [Mytilinidion resinicola]KAF2805959.1 hypothetical protein BDZ99DRAFT_501503 [Mytilinidion resinicola]
MAASLYVRAGVLFSARTCLVPTCMVGKLRAEIQVEGPLRRFRSAGSCEPRNSKQLQVETQVGPLRLFCSAGSGEASLYLASIATQDEMRILGPVSDALGYGFFPDCPMWDYGDHDHPTTTGAGRTGQGAGRGKEDAVVERQGKPAQYSNHDGNPPTWQYETSGAGVGGRGPVFQCVHSLGRYTHQSSCPSSSARHAMFRFSDCRIAAFACVSKTRLDAELLQHTLPEAQISHGCTLTSPSTASSRSEPRLEDEPAFCSRSVWLVLKNRPIVSHFAEKSCDMHPESGNRGYHVRQIYIVVAINSVGSAGKLCSGMLGISPNCSSMAGTGSFPSPVGYKSSAAGCTSRAGSSNVFPTALMEGL